MFLFGIWDYLTFKIIYFYKQAQLASDTIHSFKPYVLFTLPQFKLYFN